MMVGGQQAQAINGGPFAELSSAIAQLLTEIDGVTRTTYDVVANLVGPPNPCGNPMGEKKQVPGSVVGQCMEAIALMNKKIVEIREQLNRLR